MVTSLKELKSRLGEFLANPEVESEFRVWFAEALRDAHKSTDSAVEALAHEIMWAFLDQKRGLCTSAELLEELTRLVTQPYVCYDPNGVETSTTSSAPLEAAEIVLGASRVAVGCASVSS